MRSIPEQLAACMAALHALDAVPVAARLTAGDYAGATGIEAIVCLRALVEVAGWAAAGELDGKSGHPWLVNGDAFAKRLSAQTSAAVRAR
jgi:hypothetical protein